jgi:uncharacterized protein (TIGR03435 family)
MSRVIFGAMVVTSFIACGQVPLKFEVASIKEADPANWQDRLLMQPGGRLIANISIKGLIAFAYDVPSDEIEGAPKWIDSMYSIEARAETAAAVPSGAAGLPQIRLMTQSLLADRLMLVVRREAREELVYDLVVDKNGSKLVPNEQPGGLRSGRGQPIGTGVFVSGPVRIGLAHSLSLEVGRPVIDKTNLNGRYNFTLQWTPDSSDPDSPAVANGPSIFTALREQLGLRLVSTKGPVEILVIDHN